MKNVDPDLADALLSARFLSSGYAACIGWAAGRLGAGADDPAIGRLAGRDAGDATAIGGDCEEILGGDPAVDPALLQEWAGRYLARAGRLFAEGGMDLEAIQGPIARLAEILGKPDWLVILARNCEYAQGLPAYRAAFEAELKYLSRLWTHAPLLPDFLRAYDQRVSSKHNPV